MFELHEGDCLGVLPTLEANSVDSIITDPPYGLSFMSKDWDHGIPGVRFWTEALRVAKPGAMLLAFGGTRTWHRLAVAIEDAGWEIRDTVFWIHGQGFPKSLNLEKALLQVRCECGIMVVDGKVKSDTGTVEAAEAGAARKEPPTEHRLRPLRGANLPPTLDAETKCWEVLQPGVSEQDAPAQGPLAANDVRGGQPGLEGRSNPQAQQGQLRGTEVHKSAGVGASDGKKGRVHTGAPSNNGTSHRAAAISERGSASQEPQYAGQSHQQSRAVARQREPQESRVGQDCPRCGKPYIPQELIQRWAGYGTALKPSVEPVIVAMKPRDGTFAENALTWGVAGLWIDGCRVETGDNLGRALSQKSRSSPVAMQASPAGAGSVSDDWTQGRWPANVIHDGSDEVVRGFPVTTSGKLTPDMDVKPSSGWSGGSQANRVKSTFAANSGSAARFFYVAKASRSERNAGLEGLPEKMVARMGHGNNEPDEKTQAFITQMQNHHPTVKPLELMRYLCRLTKTPTGGVVLDPFMGSGTTGIAAVLEGRDFIGIEQEPEYVEIARRRIEYHAAQPEQLELIDA